MLVIGMHEVVQRADEGGEGGRLHKAQLVGHGPPARSYSQSLAKVDNTFLQSNRVQQLDFPQNIAPGRTMSILTSQSGVRWIALWVPSLVYPYTPAFNSYEVRSTTSQIDLAMIALSNLVLSYSVSFSTNAICHYYE